MSDSTILFLLIAGGFWLWWDSRGVAEIAIAAARRHCEQVGVAFLNDTVAWKKVRLQRGYNGRMQIERSYYFEFSSDIARRYEGQITMLGKRVKSVQLEPHRLV
jgi:hypothetical protein